MGDWSSTYFVGCFGNCSLSIITCCLAPLAIYKNAEAVGEPGLAWMLTIMMAGPCAGSCLRHKIAKSKGVDENFWLGCLYWYICPCLALCQETAHVGGMEGYIPNEISEAERQTKSSVQPK